MKKGLTPILVVAALGFGIFCLGHLLFATGDGYFDSRSALPWQSPATPKPAARPLSGIATPPLAADGGLVSKPLPAPSASDKPSPFQPNRPADRPPTPAIIGSVHLPAIDEEMSPLPQVTIRGTSESGERTSHPDLSQAKVVNNPYSGLVKPDRQARPLPPVDPSTESLAVASPSPAAQPAQPPALAGPAPGAFQPAAPKMDIDSPPATESVSGDLRNSPFVAQMAARPKAAGALPEQPAVVESSPFQPAMTPSLELQNETPLPDRRSANDMASTPTGPASSEPAASDSSLVVEQRAREHMNYGNSLARRGATFAAREEFIQALQLIADARDFQDQTRQYTSSLAEGLRALHESDDFVTLGAEQQLNLELAPIVAMHSSDVISEQDARGLRPVQALQAYYQYASEKISHAVGRSRVAGETLHALGKLMLATASYDAAGKPVDKAKAMVMFQAALVACPDEYRSANELGVLMARNGKWDRAQYLFTRSLQIEKTPEAWINLAKTHEHLGETELARLANNEYRLMTESGARDSGGSMAWVSPEQFDSSGATPAIIDETGATRTASRTEEPAESKPVGKGVFGSFKKWF